MFTMLKQGGNYIDDKHGVYTEYVCSSADDVANLPTGANSEAVDRPRPRQYSRCAERRRWRGIRICSFKRAYLGAFD